MHNVLCSFPSITKHFTNPTLYSPSPVCLQYAFLSPAFQVSSFVFNFRHHIPHKAPTSLLRVNTPTARLWSRCNCRLCVQTRWTRTHALLPPVTTSAAESTASCSTGSIYGPEQQVLLRLTDRRSGKVEGRKKKRLCVWGQIETNDYHWL